MTLNQEMEKHGFGPSSRGGECEWYTKEIQHKCHNDFITFTERVGFFREVLNG